MKPVSSLAGHAEKVAMPKVLQRGPELDFEAELAVVIGKRGRDIPRSRALEYIFGYTCANDLTARRWQKHAGGGQWIRGKGFAGFCALGPFLVTRDEITDVQNLRVCSFLNDELMQDGNTAEMIFPIADLIAYLSEDTWLLPGTVILTGTPAGVGYVRKPPRYLRENDIVRVEISGLGQLENKIVSPENGND